MIDWLPIDGHDLNDDEEAIFYTSIDRKFLGYFSLNEGYGPGIMDSYNDEYSFIEQFDFRDIHSSERITHFARVNGPGPNTLREVWERYRGFDWALSDPGGIAPGNSMLVLYELWQAIKAALNISQSVTESVTQDENFNIPADSGDESSAEEE